MPVCGKEDDMQYIIFVMLILAVVSLIILLRQKENQLKGLKQQLGETQDIIKRSDAKKNKLEEIQTRIWDYGNTIHLYAALCEEETGNPSVKEKQREIMIAAKALLQLTENELNKED